MTKRILIVEDQEDNRTIMREVLSTVGYDLIEALNEEDAVRLAQSEQPDLVLMDIQMPVLDGYEATRRIKAIAELRSIPIIAVTSYALSGDEAKARAAGCDGYIAKPFSPRELLAGYSITSSARARMVGGISRSSALAVLRLMTSLNFVGACTGKSAGFSPLRMRST